MHDLLITVRKSDGKYTVEIEGGKTYHVQDFILSESVLPEIESLIGSSLAAYGEHLFRAFFQPLRGAFMLAKHNSGNSPISIRLNIRDAYLSSLPWETLRDEHGYLALDMRTPLIRHLEGGSVRSDSYKIRDKIHLLYSAASPENVVYVNTNESFAKIEHHLTNLAIVHPLRNTTPKSLTQALLRSRTTPYDILHYDGHAALGELWLEDGDNGVAPFSAEELANILKGSGIRLVVLAACYTATGSIYERFSGIAQTLIDQEAVSAVVAMQFAISNVAASAFIEGLYQSLAQGHPVDVAVTWGRLAIRAVKGEQDSSWFSPVLYLRGTTNLFTFSTHPSPHIGLEPYPGLLSFSEANQHLFFGRDARIEELLGKVSHEPFTAVIGASGSGKSSLIHAGLVPTLKGERKTDGKLPQNSKAWAYHVCTPGNAPLTNLATELTSSWSTTSVTRAAQEAAELHNYLSESVNALAAFTRAYLRAFGKAGLILVVDQFEELFTDEPQEMEAKARREQERVQFIGNLTNAASILKGNDVHIVIVMRADFYHHCVEYEALRPLLQKHQYIVGSMARTELRTAIEQPALRTGFVFDLGLPERILDDIGQEPGNLPLLAHALQQMWQKREGNRLTHASYQNTGGVKGAIAKTAETVYRGFTAEQQIICKRIFLDLTTLGEGAQDTRRRVSKDTLDKNTIIESVVRKLVEQRLIVTDGGTGSTIEVAHEALIREWTRLRQWIQESRERLRSLRRLEEEAKEWYLKQCNSSWLLKGGKLEEARLVLEDKTVNIILDVKHFIEQSIAAYQNELQSALERAESYRLAEEAARHEATQNKSMRLAIQGEQYLQRGAWNTAMVFGIESLRLFPTQESYQLLHNLLTHRPKTFLTLQHEDRVSHATWNGDSTRIITASYDNTAVVWDAITGLPLITLRHKGGVNHVAWNRDYTLVATASSDTTAIVWNTSDGTQHLTLQHLSEVNHVAWNKDNTLLATASGDWTGNGRVTVWDALTGVPILILPHEDRVNYVEWSSNGTQLATISGNRTTRVWNGTTGNPIVQLHHEDKVNYVVWNRNDKYIITASSDTTAVVWDSATGTRIVTLQHKSGINHIAQNLNGTRIVTASSDTTAVVWDISVGNPLLTLQHDGGVNYVAWSRDNTRIVTVSYDRTARIWDAKKGTLLLTLQHEDWINYAAWSRDGTRIITASGDWTQYGTVKVWDATLVPTRLKLENQGGINHISWNKDSTRIVTASGDWTERSTATLWDAITGTMLLTLQHEDKVNHAVWNRDGSRVVTASSDRTAVVWDAMTGTALYTLPHKGGVNHVAWSQDDTQIVTASSDKTATVWDARFGTRIHTLYHEGEVNYVAWDSGGSRIVTTSNNRTTTVWDVMKGTPVITLHHKGGVNHVALSRDGIRLIISSGDGISDSAGVVWDLSTGKILLTLPHKAKVNYADWSRDSKRIITASGEGLEPGTAVVWDATTGTALLTLQHRGSVNQALWSNGDSRVATASEDGTVVVWDIETGTPLLTLQHEANVSYIAWSSDGNRIITASDDRTTVVWETTLDKLKEAVYEATTANITTQAWKLYFNEPYSTTRPEYAPLIGQAKNIAKVGHYELALSHFQCLLKYFQTQEPTEYQSLKAAYPTLVTDIKQFVKQYAVPVIWGQGRELAERGEVKKAIAKFREAQHLDPSFIQIDPTIFANLVATGNR